jgi:hypothetical protein
VRGVRGLLLFTNAVISARSEYQVLVLIFRCILGITQLLLKVPTISLAELHYARKTETTLSIKTCLLSLVLASDLTHKPTTVNSYPPLLTKHVHFYTLPLYNNFIMAPMAVDVYPVSHIQELKARAQQVVAQATAPAKLIKTPMQLAGALDKFESFDVTPVIGKEFPTASLAEWLKAPNADELIRDLAITGKCYNYSDNHALLLPFGYYSPFCVMFLTSSIVSQRGVVFFRGQKDLDNNLQKELCQKLGLLTGKPAESSMHIHPISNKSFQCNKDDEISVISNDLATKIFNDRNAEQHKKKQSLKKGWHSDITFEPVPSDYAILKLTDLPTIGGGKFLFLFILASYTNTVQILSGPPVTKSTTASPPPTKNSSTVSLPPTPNPSLPRRPRTKNSSSTLNPAVTHLTSVRSFPPNTQSSEPTQLLAGRPFSQLVTTFNISMV